MSTKKENVNVKYTIYKEEVLKRLTETKTKTKIKPWKQNGIWKRNGKCTEKAHILPLNGNPNKARYRADAIKQCLCFDCKPYFPNNFVGLHQYAHHLNSSQLLCLMFFSKLIDNKNHATQKLVDFMEKAFNIAITTEAYCLFEYKEKNINRYMFDIFGVKEYEGTSFDFHIKDKNMEVFFEIKFTENGFGNAKKDTNGRHECKAKKYVELLPESLKRITTTDDILNYYQLFRNIIRANDKSKYVIFITDNNNPSTNKEISTFKNKFFKFIDSKQVIFETWQNLKKTYTCFNELPFQFNAIL